MMRGETKAKLNLSLRVVGKRADGYHLLQSVVAFCEVGDVLQVQPAVSLALSITGKYSAGLSSTDNSVMRAAHLLQQHAHVTTGAWMQLEKNLPVASGIGGGSGDAALALHLLNELWGCGYSTQDLMQLALPLGADVPVCLQGQHCLMEGIGERITPLAPMPAYYAVLVNPLIEVATAEIFNALAWGEDNRCHSREGGNLLLIDTILKEAYLTHLHTQQNDLQPIAIAHYPEIGEILNRLAQHPACLLARMSGSGATCFALCEGKEDATQLMHAMQQHFPHYWVACGKVG